MVQNITEKRTGFTLVELLVVIAIIGLLSTIVLVSFGPVRNQARDTTIKANLNQMRLAAEMQYASAEDYTGSDSRDDYIAAAASVVSATGTVTDNFDTDAYCIQSTLASSGSWCTDSTGYIGSTSVSCDGTNYDCDSD